jgi:ArsR family transcriptional regulator
VPKKLADTMWADQRPFSQETFVSLSGEPALIPSRLGSDPSTFIYKSARLMDVNVPAIELEPPRSLGQGCCARVDVELSTTDVRHLSDVAKALSDPVRVQIVDVLRRQAGEVCVCDLQPLFDISQPTLSHHLKRLRDVGIVGVERRGQWAYYYVIPASLQPLSAWLEP